MAVQDEVILRLHSGIPVVEIGGEWSVKLVDMVTSMLTSLQHAGHFEIVLNIQRAALGSMAGLRSLGGIAQAFRSHHGHLDIVGTIEQIEELSGEGLAGPFRLASSVESALSRIKGTRVLAGGPRYTARTLD